MCWFEFGDGAILLMKQSVKLETPAKHLKAGPVVFGLKIIQDIKNTRLKSREELIYHITMRES